MSIPFDVLDAQCPSRRVLMETTGRWGSLVLFALSNHAQLRFSELFKLIGGVSERMLSRTLSTLVEDGLVDHQTDRAPSTYSLTPLGERLAKRVGALVDELYAVMPEVVAPVAPTK